MVWKFVSLYQNPNPQSHMLIIWKWASLEVMWLKRLGHLLCSNFSQGFLRVSKSTIQKSQEVPETDELHNAFPFPSLYKQ